MKLAPARQLIAVCLISAVLGQGATAPAEGDLRRDATVEAVEKVLPAVVNVSTATVVQVSDPFEEVRRRFFGGYRRPATRAQYSLGSGVVVLEEGYILTNDHVVRRADKIEVTLGTNAYSAKIVAQNTSTDLALLKITNAPAGARFTAIRFAGDEDLYLGETVLALGNPFGLGGSVSRGILSSKNRRPYAEKGPLDVEDWLQTDAAINPGNSGGPLIDLRGELIGLNVAIYREGEAQGIGFAIPMKRISETLSDIFTPEEVRGEWFGARLRPGAGAPLVAEVQRGSPADRAGVRRGDLVLRVDEKTPRGFMEATGMILRHEGGDLLLTLRRGGENREVRVRLSPLLEVIRQSLGLTLKARELTPDAAARLKLEQTTVLAVAAVEKGGPAARLNLRPDDILVAIDEHEVSSLTGAARALAGKSRGDKAVLAVLAWRDRGAYVEWAGRDLEMTVR